MTVYKQIHWLDKPIQNRACYLLCKYSQKVVGFKLNTCSCKNCPYYKNCDYRVERRQNPRTPINEGKE